MTLLRILLVALLLPACGASGGTRQVADRPTGEPYIVGEITSVSVTMATPGPDGARQILIRALDGGNEASITVTSETPVWEEFGGGLEPSRIDRLGQGQTVSVWASGAVAESFPVQAEADAVVIRVE